MAQTSSGLDNSYGLGAGVTPHYAITYDDSLSQADGEVTRHSARRFHDATGRSAQNRQEPLHELSIFRPPVVCRKLGGVAE
jgi:hypothetical protein